MENAIKLKNIGEKIKVVSFKNHEFLEKAHELHGTYREPAAWYFDNIYIDEVRSILLKLWSVTGEQDYEECTLYVRKFSASVENGPVYLFNRLIAQSFGHGRKSVLGEDIKLIFGRYRVGGTIRHWTTEVVDVTMEIERFPLPAISTPAVRNAIAEGWCVVRRTEGARTSDIVEADIEVCQFNLNRFQRELLILKGMKSGVA